MKNLKLGVIIVTYNRIALLKECINACLKQTYKFEKIYIINNNSTDDTQRFLDNLKNDKIEIVNLEKNIGGAGGFYTGIELAVKDSAVDFLLLIDDDAILDENYNFNIVNGIIDEIDAYSGSVYTDEKIVLDHRCHLKKNAKRINSKKSEYNNKYFDYELSTFCGLYISLKLIKKIGLPKKDFFIWYDDTEYSMRINKFSKIRNINNAILNHKTKNYTNGDYSWKSYYGIRNRLVILKEYYPKFIFKKAIIGVYKNIIKFKLFYIFKKDNYYLNISNMFKIALKDALNNEMGISEIFYPGAKIN